VTARRLLPLLLAAGAAALPAAAAAQGPAVTINELHYDNAGTDTGEAIEVAAPQGTNLSGWSLVLYNGSGGASYATRTLSGTVGASRVAVVELPVNGLQNGSPDGVALVEPDGDVAQFLSYEGTFTATNGPAAGQASTDIGVAEGASTPVGQSLQRTGTANTWTGPRAATFGCLNEGQQLDGATGSASCGGAPQPAARTIPEIQGTGARSPFAGDRVVTEGVVVGDFQGGLRGFFLQDPAGDGNPHTSDGLFAFGTQTAVDEGDVVRVTGTVTEFDRSGGSTDSLTELTDISVEVVSRGAARPAAAPIDLPVSREERERLEGMRVRSGDALVVTELYNLGFGEVLLGEGAPLVQPTELMEPGPAAAQADRANADRSLLLDDGRSGDNRNPIAYTSAGDALRRGDALTGPLEGVLHFDFDQFRVQPTGAVGFAERNPRPPAPGDLGGDVTVGSFNVLNYFLTFGRRDEDRGAPSRAELEQQRAKVVEAIDALDASVVALQEIQNTADPDDPFGGDPDVALRDLVAALNADAGEARWAHVPAPDPYGETDEIRVALIYQRGEVSPVGPSVAFPDPAFTGLARVPVAQTFRSGTERFTVVANHFKSKGCRDAAGANADQGDGQSCYTAARVEQARAMLRFVDRLRAQTDDDDVLVAGDLNSYTQEDPIDVLRDGGLVNLLARHVPLARRYTYVFQGRQGVLDHAFATPSLAGKVTGAAIWHLNADEARIAEYGGFGELYAEDPYRSSDHDAIAVGVDDDTAPTCRGRRATIVGTEGPDTLRGTNGNDVIVAFEGADRIATGNGDDVVCAGVGDDTVDTGNGDDDLRGGPGEDALDGGNGRDAERQE